MLTAVQIEKLSTPDKRREVPDGRIRGLYLIVQPSGVKSWALRYRAHGIPRKLTLGSFPAVDLATARRRAQEALGELAGGNDPAATKKASRAAARAAREADEDRIERVIELFVERYAKPKTKDWRETAAMLNREVAGRWKGRRLSQITRADVHQMLDEIVDRGAPIAANRRFAAFRKMCKWAVARGIIDRSPCEGVSAPAAETKRERVLTDDELKSFGMRASTSAYSALSCDCSCSRAHGETKSPEWNGPSSIRTLALGRCPRREQRTNASTSSRWVTRRSTSLKGYRAWRAGGFCSQRREGRMSAAFPKRRPNLTPRCGR